MLPRAVESAVSGHMWPAGTLHCPPLFYNNGVALVKTYFQSSRLKSFDYMVEATFFEIVVQYIFVYK